MSHRKEQIESTLRRAVSQVLVRKMSDPRIAGLVGITRIHVSDDLRNADVYVTVIPEKYEKRTIAGLRAAAGYIHEQSAKLVQMRTVPHFQFKLDAELKKQEAIYDAIAKGLDREGLDPAQIPHVTSGEPVATEDDEDLDEDELAAVDELEDEEGDEGEEESDDDPPAKKKGDPAGDGGDEDETRWEACFP